MMEEIAQRRARNEVCCHQAVTLRKQLAIALEIPLNIFQMTTKSYSLSYSFRITISDIETRSENESAKTGTEASGESRTECSTEHSCSSKTPGPKPHMISISVPPDRMGNCGNNPPYDDGPIPTTFEIALISTEDDVMYDEDSGYYDIGTFYSVKELTDEIRRICAYFQ